MRSNRKNVFARSSEEDNKRRKREYFDTRYPWPKDVRFVRHLFSSSGRQRRWSPWANISRRQSSTEWARSLEKSNSCSLYEGFVKRALLISSVLGQISLVSVGAAQVIVKIKRTVSLCLRRIVGIFQDQIGSTAKSRAMSTAFHIVLCQDWVGFSSRHFWLPFSGGKIAGNSPINIGMPFIGHSESLKKIWETPSSWHSNDGLTQVGSRACQSLIGIQTLPTRTSYLLTDVNRESSTGDVIGTLSRGWFSLIVRSRRARHLLRAFPIDANESINTLSHSLLCFIFCMSSSRDRDQQVN